MMMVIGNNRKGTEDWFLSVGYHAAVTTAQAALETYMESLGRSKEEIEEFKLQLAIGMVDQQDYIISYLEWANTLT